MMGEWHMSEESRSDFIDLRSDTVTKPTEAMRRAMYEAEVADDTYDGDPTVSRLQEMAAEMTSMEAALFVVSGTMGNLLGVLVNTHPGQEVILGDESHQFLWEVGGIARIANCVTHTVPFHKGWLNPDEIKTATRSPSREATTTGLICVEDTSNSGGGAVIPPEHLAKIWRLAKSHALPVYLDGARIFNASVAMGQPVTEFTQNVNMVSFCLSKGLGAPFGAMLCGNKDSIKRAITFRQMLGGGMRQAGVMAAAGIVALKTGVERLAEDHANANKLAIGLAELIPDCCDVNSVKTNIVLVELTNFSIKGQGLADYFAREGILVFPSEARLRLVTHRMVSTQDIDLVLNVFYRLLGKRYI